MVTDMSVESYLNIATLQDDVCDELEKLNTPTLMLLG
jgi:hypothetical protein